MTDNKKENNTSNQQNNQKKPGGLPGGYRRAPFSWLLILLIILLVMTAVREWQQVQEVRWDEFVGHIKAGNVSEVVIKETEIDGKFTDDYAEQHDILDFVVYYRSEIHGERLESLLDEYGVSTRTEPSRAWLWNLLGLLFPLLILGFFFYFIFVRSMRGGGPGGMLMSFGRSKHRLQGKDRNKITFKNVAGIEEAKDEVGELIEFLKDPKKFQRLGGRIPRGVLLIGPPGCGKTLLAKAIAGEADVPFLSISGSDFVEMFVGVGASRVRDLFNQAKQNSPCIIFLDEIDAIGRKRGASIAGGGHDEREQTLNAILVEMDGFDTNDQVIVIAATNRGDMLDNALTRPGRFDRQIVVPLPDLRGRLEILKVHAKKIKLSSDADLERLARGTPMFSGADLAAIINEAALMATMENKDFVEMVDLEEARDKVRWGRAKRSRFTDKKEREITAYHEAGHTLVQSLLEDADPLHKVSIIPRGPMGGGTFALPEKDRNLFTRKYCQALLQVCLGGRVSEEIFCDDITSGAQQDIKQATNIAKQMVLNWGMSKNLGLVNYDGDKDSEYPIPQRSFSEKTAEEIDNEIRELVNEAYKKAQKLMLDNRDKVENIARGLLKFETLDAADVQMILDGKELDKQSVTDLITAEKEKSDGNDKTEQEDKTSKEQTKAKTESPETTEPEQ